MNNVSGRRVLVVGLARTGLAAARCFQRRGAVVTVTDLKPPSAFHDVIPELSTLKIGLELGSQRDETFLRHDLIVVSPGVPWGLPQLRTARERGILVVPEIEAASWFLTNRLVGITGTNGKTTTTALLGKMLETSGIPAFVGGNIGVPLISAVDRVSPETILVTELSSFQLEAIQNFRVHVAVLLNITPNHLDRHASFPDYVRAKAKIFSNLGAEDYAVLNADDSNVMSLAPAIAKGEKVFFSQRQNLPGGVSLANGHVRYRVGHLEGALLETRDVRLRGAFNLENVLAASTAACVLGADLDAVRRAVREFQGVEHRLEFVRQVGGVEFYNDSKATSVDAAAKALSTFAGGVHVILGGKDKGAPYAPLRPLLEGRVRAAYLIGEAADRIAEELAGAAQLIRAGDLENAVREAFERAGAGDTVLLSPACASFDQFQDYEHRGRVFKQIVESLAREAEEGQDREKGKKKSRRSPTSSSAPPDSKSGPRQAQGASGPLERINVYEVGAEELARDEEFGGRAKWPDNKLLSAELRSPEMVQDEPLPFEVPVRDQTAVSRLASPSGGTAGHKASGAGAEEAEYPSPGGDASGQRRPSGM
jgi:UDP-N-acetylmuramoylalanine--D-glutamate ligase